MQTHTHTRARTHTHTHSACNFKASQMKLRLYAGHCCWKGLWLQSHRKKALPTFRRQTIIRCECQACSSSSRLTDCSRYYKLYTDKIYILLYIYIYILSIYTSWLAISLRGPMPAIFIISSKSQLSLPRHSSLALALQKVAKSERDFATFQQTLQKASQA